MGWFFMEHNEVLMYLVSLSYGQVILLTNNIVVFYFHNLGIWKMGLWNL